MEIARKILLLVLLTFFSCLAFCENQPAHNYIADTIASDKVAAIRRVVAIINNELSKYKKITLSDVENESTEGNEINKFVKDRKIKKLTAIYEGETGKLYEEYYFNNDKLIFFYSKEDSYKLPINVNPAGKIASSKERRFYFYNGKLFLAKFSPHKTVSHSEFEKLSDESQKEADRLLKLK